MTTIKQNQAFKKIVENHGNISKSMLEVGYSPETAKNPSNLTNSKGWQELMAKHLPDNDLIKVHKEGLKATKIFSSHTEPDKTVPDYGVRHKYLETAYKIKNRFQDNIIAEQKVLDVRITQIINKVYGVRPDND